MATDTCCTLSSCVLKDEYDLCPYSSASVIHIVVSVPKTSCFMFYFIVPDRIFVSDVDFCDIVAALFY